MKTANKKISQQNLSRDENFTLPPIITNQQEMITLPREVLKWIQSLDLTYSVKNVKKDFINGFLVAQILSRYFPANVQMHTIDNGFSREKRRDNWNMISKYLREINDLYMMKQNKPLVKIDNIEFMIDNRENEILYFLIKLYQELTNRKIIPIEGRIMKTDVDPINKSYLLKETGEVELIKRDTEQTDKKLEELQKSVKSNSTILTQYKTQNIVMKGEMKPIANNVSNLDSKNFKINIFEPKESESPTKLLRQVKVPNPNQTNLERSFPKSEKHEDHNANYAQLIMTDSPVDQDNQIDKIKNPFEWLEENLLERMQLEFREDFNKIKIQGKFLYVFFKSLDTNQEDESDQENVSTECLQAVLNDINNMIEEYFNILSEQVNEYVNLFLIIFEAYITISITREKKFEILHNSLITFFQKSLRNKSEEMFFIFRNVFLEKIFEVMSDLEYKERLGHICQLLFKILDPSDNQQVDLFKLLKENIKNELILYTCFSNLHDMMTNYSENLVDAILFYVLNGVLSQNTEIRYHSLFILMKYSEMNPNFFFNFERKLEKLSKKEIDRESCLILIKMSCYYMKNAYIEKTKTKENLNKKIGVGFSDKFEDDVNYLNELNMGNNIIKNIMMRFMGDNLFVLLSSLIVSEFLCDNTELQKTLLISLFQSHENIIKYIFYDDPLDFNIEYVFKFYPFRHAPQLAKFKDFNIPFLLKSYDIMLKEKEQNMLSDKDYVFINFLLKNGIVVSYSEIYKNYFRFSKLVIQDIKDINRCKMSLKILEVFLFCETISKHIFDECYDNLQIVFRDLVEDINLKPCKEIVVNLFIQSWFPNASSILKDGLKKIFEILNPSN